MLVNIHLDELDLAARRLDRFFENRRELFAGFASGLTRRFHQDIGAEACRGGIFHKRPGRLSRHGLVCGLAGSLPAFVAPPAAEYPRHVPALL
jgi:hypothetical protein